MCDLECVSDADIFHCSVSTPGHGTMKPLGDGENDGYGGPKDPQRDDEDHLVEWVSQLHKEHPSLGERSFYAFSGYWADSTELNQRAGPQYMEDMMKKEDGREIKRMPIVSMDFSRDKEYNPRRPSMPDSVIIAPGSMFNPKGNRSGNGSDEEVEISYIYTGMPLHSDEADRRPWHEANGDEPQGKASHCAYGVVVVSERLKVSDMAPVGASEWRETKRVIDIVFDPSKVVAPEDGTRTQLLRSVIPSTTFLTLTPLEASPTVRAGWATVRRGSRRVNADHIDLDYHEYDLGTKKEKSGEPSYFRWLLGPLSDSAHTTGSGVSPPE